MSEPANINSMQCSVTVAAVPASELATNSVMPAQKAPANKQAPGKRLPTGQETNSLPEATSSVSPATKGHPTEQETNSIPETTNSGTLAQKGNRQAPGKRLPTGQETNSLPEETNTVSEDSGHGVQVVEILEDHSYRLNEEALAGVLTQEAVRDLPVAVVSLTGAARSGKSFLLNFFLRYLTAPDSAREDGSWLGSNEEPLTGFEWRGGTKRATSGIQFWSKPLLVTLRDKSKVAVLLMDTQGTFDNQSTVRDCSTIFGLSVLLSSVQIYNLSGGNGIQEDDLQALEQYSQYGRMVSDSDGTQKPFQVLDVLVRDWGNDDEYAYGHEGGQKYFDKIMKVSSDMPSELRALREHLRESFETLACFLMPHPGLIVTRKAFEGKVADIDTDFIVHLRQLISSIFSPEKIKPRSINGHVVKCGEFYTYFKTYMKVFNSKDIPTPKSIRQASVEAGLLLATQTALDLYYKSMEEACGENAPAMSEPALEQLHQQTRTTALAAFQNTKKLATPEEAQQYLAKLTTDIDARLEQFLSINIAKMEKISEAANAAYEKKISQISGKNPFCVHPDDVAAVHDEALEAVRKIFKVQGSMSFGDDSMREAFLENFGNIKLQLLRNTNEQNNKVAVAYCRDGYWDYMTKEFAKGDIKANIMNMQHRVALDHALEQFKLKRSRPDQHPNDVFKSTLTTEILVLHGTMMSSTTNKLEELTREQEKLATEQKKSIERLKAERERLLLSIQEQTKQNKSPSFSDFIARTMMKFLSNIIK